MNDNMLDNLQNFSVRLNEKRIIFGSSYSLLDCDIYDLIIHKDISVLLDYLFNSVFFKNSHIINKINNFIDNTMVTRKGMHSNIVGLNQNEGTNNYCDFMFGIDVFFEPHITFTIKIQNFKLTDTRYGDYEEIFHDFTTDFSIMKSHELIAKFVVDFKKNPHIMIANKVLPTLLDIEKSYVNEYFISIPGSNEPNTQIFKNKAFFNKFDLLIKDEISLLEDVWKNNDKWLKVEAKILKREYNGTPLLLGGVVYEITDFVKYKDLEYLHSVYEFAITSGSIGIFYYNHDKYPKEYFEANDIYIKMFGLHPNKDNLYCLKDFEKSLLPLEEDISKNTDIKKSLKNLIKGSIDGTSDDILKIKNKETNEIKYLLSSSKIDARYDNGIPRRFGGIVIDITDRIQSQKNQIEYAYMDELTSLSNYRKLLKDMIKRKKGIGLFYDLDHFKLINDVHGHVVGNKILQLFANTLTKLSVKYPNTYSYRLYGDEFFIYCDDVKMEFGDIYNAELKLALQKTVSKHYSHIKVEASMGIAIYDCEKPVDEFIKSADYDMYKEKIYKSEHKTKKQ